MHLSLAMPIKYTCLWQLVHMLKMKQLDVVVSPPAFLWDPYLTLTYEIFDLDICGL